MREPLGRPRERRWPDVARRPVVPPRPGTHLEDLDDIIGFVERVTGQAGAEEPEGLPEGALGAEDLGTDLDSVLRGILDEAAAGEAGGGPRGGRTTRMTGGSRHSRAPATHGSEATARARAQRHTA